MPSSTPQNWTESAILSLIQSNNWKESIDLDFKQTSSLGNSDTKKDEISKDVSAMANSAGGVIIYGIVENGHVATSLDTGSDPSIISKEWLEQVINSRIHRKIDGIRISQIDLRSSNPGKVIYIVIIPQSNRTPHQSSNKKFYKRFNFESEPMEEYEIRDLYRRSDSPDLQVDFSLVSNQLTRDEVTSEYGPAQLNMSIINNAIEAAEYATIKLFMDNNLEVKSTGGLDNLGPGTLTIGGNIIPITILQKNWGIPANLPIFSERFRVNDNPILLKLPPFNVTDTKKYLLGYEIRSPKMEPKQFFTYLTLQHGQVSINPNYQSPSDLISSQPT